MMRDRSVQATDSHPASADLDADPESARSGSNRRLRPLSITTFRALRGALICVAVTAGAALGIVLLASRQLAETTRELTALGDDLVGLREDVQSLARRVAASESVLAESESAGDTAADAGAGTTEVVGDESLEEVRFRLAAVREGLREVDERQQAIDTVAELARMADEAVVHGSRFAYRKLMSRLGEIDTPELRDAAEAQLMRVDSYYVSTRPFQAYVIPVTEIHPTASREEDLRPDDLRRILSSAELPWSFRAKAARLLGESKEDDDTIAAALMDAIRTDSHLAVVQESLIALENLTTFQADGVFDEQGAVAWWDDNH